MPSVVDVTLNVAAGVIVAIILATSVREDLVRFFAIAYAVFFCVAMIVQDGGQVNGAVAIGLLVYAVLTWLADDKNAYDAIVKQRETVKIFRGVMNAKANAARSYNTYDPTSPTYKRLPRSVNRMGGAQFSYSFWLMFDRGVADDEVAGRTLFMRGDARHYSPMVSTSDDKDLPRGRYFGDAGADYAIACPRVSFLAANRMAVDINTDRDLRSRFVVGSSEPAVEMRKNALSLIPGHFTLFTVVFEDNVGVDSFERGIRCRFYINDQLYHTGTAPGALRQNEGPLHLFLDPTPDTRVGIDACRMADLTYYNYALEDKDVAGLYARGFENSEAKDDKQVFDKDVRLVMSAYNKMDLSANYDDRLHSASLSAP